MGRQTAVVRLSPLILCLCLLIFSGTQSRADSIVAEGFKKFSSNGSAAALNTWSWQSRLLTENKVSQLASELKKTESSLGACSGFDILTSQPWGSRDTQILAVAHFNYGSLFFRFLVFQDNLGQQYINGLWYSTDPTEITQGRFFISNQTGTPRSL